jgi:hypothetical protein
MRKDDDISWSEQDGLSVFHLDESAAFDRQVVEDEVCGTGRTCSATTFDAGAENPHGAENSALKNSAPLNLTPLRISEKASIQASGLPARFGGRRAMESDRDGRSSKSRPTALSAL